MSPASAPSLSRQRFSMALRALCPIFFLAGAMHLCLGVHTEVLLGTPLPPDALGSAGLDSQNRFYGVTFTIYGFLLLLAAKDLDRYAVILRYALWITFAGGAARLIAVVLHGWPPPLVCALLAAELALPPVVAGWQRRLDL